MRSEHSVDSSEAGVRYVKRRVNQGHTVKIHLQPPIENSLLEINHYELVFYELKKGGIAPNEPY